MKNWQEDLLSGHEITNCDSSLFEKICAAAQSLGFDYCVYGLQLPTSLSKPKVISMSNGPVAFQERYVSEGYLYIDPTVKHARRSQTPIAWTEELFNTPATRALWDDAHAAGIRARWAQSCITSTGVAGMLTLSRPSEKLSSSELASQEIKMSWLVNVAHFSLSRAFMSQAIEKIQPGLTAREIEILKWTADGKTSADIAEILSISENTVNFHIKNATAKLQTSNKTAAAVRACMLGLLI